MPNSKPAAARDVPKHRACDECRSRKLACSMGTDGCSRCRRESIPCYYSPQKPMGRPCKRRPVDEADKHAAAPAPGSKASPGMNRSGSVSSSSHSAVGPEIQSFQINATPVPAPSSSFGDHHFGFLDQQGNTTPDISFCDLLPTYYQDGLAITPASSQADCPLTQASSTFHGPLPMAHDRIDAYGDMPFLDLAFTTGQLSDTLEAPYGTTLDLSIGSHAPLNLEPSFLPPLKHTRSSKHRHRHRQSVSDGFSGTEPLRPLSSVVCPCLSSLYMALESLTNLPRDIAAAIRVTRHASKVAHGVITCKVCSSWMMDIAEPPPIQAFQNMMLLAILVPSACNAYTAIIEMIDSECSLAMQQGRRMFFSLRDMGALWDHGAVAAGWLPIDRLDLENIELGHHEWRRIMLAVIRLDVYGTGEKRASRLEGPPGLISLSDIIATLDERSEKRLALIDAYIAAGSGPPVHNHYMMMPRSCRRNDRNCVRLEVARLALNGLVIA